MKHNDVEALLIEPVPFLFKKLNKAFEGFSNVKTLQAVISNSTEMVSFYTVSPKFAEDFPFAEHWKKWQLASMDRDMLLKHVDAKYIEEEKVEAKSGKEILKIVGRIDLLAVDAEGFDDVIVNSFLNVSKPKFIVFEAKNIDAKTFEEKLGNIGYKCSPCGAYWFNRNCQLLRV